MPELPENRFSPIFIDRFFTGIWVQRSPLQDPSTATFSRYYGGRPDALIDGVNVELTNRLTLARRPGCVPYSSATFPEAVNSFYAFKQFTTSTETITLMVDGISTISSLSPASKTTLLVKGNGAGQASFLGVGNILYIGDGVDQQAWNGTSATTRNWGVAMDGSSASAYAGTGASGSSGGAQNQGPNGPDTFFGSYSGPNFIGGSAWNDPANAQLLDGFVASVDVEQNSDPDNPFSTYSDYLEVYGFNFSVPDNATIDGIQVSVYTGGSVQDRSVKIVQDAHVDGTEHADSALWNGTKTYGGSSDLWGLVWTPAKINTPGFGFAISASPNGDGLLTATVDYISIIVYYTTPAIPSWTNPSNIVGAPDATYTTASSGPLITTAALTASNYGLGVSGTILGVQASITGHVSSPTAPQLTIQLQDSNGNLVGKSKTVSFSSTSDVTVILGGAADMWGAHLNASNVTGSSFGVQIVAFDPTAEFFLDACNIKVWTLPQPTVTPQGSGSFSATTGYRYLFEYRNSSGGDASNASAASDSTGTFSSKANCAVAITASPDPQVNEIWVFRTTDGGTTFFALPTNPYPNTSTTITDSASDASLNTNVLAARASQNTLPPVGIGGMVYHMGKVWGFVENTLYYSSGSDLGNILGNGSEGFPPANNFVYPARVSRLVPTAVGLIVFTVSDIHIVYGNGSATAATAGVSGITVFYSTPLLAHIGLLNQFALDVNGTTIYFFTSDNQLLSLDPSAGVSEIGYPIGAPSFAYPNEASLTQQSILVANITATAVSDNLAIYTASNQFVVGQSVTVAGTSNDSGIFNVTSQPIIARDSDSFTIRMIASDFTTAADAGTATITVGYSPQNTYVTWHVQGSQDKAIYVSDGNSGWFRCNTSLAPEGNFVWSPKAGIVGGCQAVQSIETSSGTYQLLIGPGSAGGLVLVRNLNVFSDNNVPFPSNFKMGSMVLAQPGQIAEVAFITCDFNKIGTSPTLSVLLNEISGSFENISTYVHQDPPSLYGVTLAPATLYANRYELLQTVPGNPDQNPVGAFCRHMQIEVDFGSTDTVQNELLDLTVFGAMFQEK